MTDFDLYQPQKWLRDGLVAASRLGRSVKKGKTQRASGHGPHWQWIAATAVGTILSGTPAYSSNQIHSQFGTAFVIDSISLDQKVLVPASSEVPTGYWSALQRALQHAEQLPEYTEFDDPTVIV